MRPKSGKLLLSCKMREGKKNTPQKNILERGVYICPETNRYMYVYLFFYVCIKTLIEFVLLTFQHSQVFLYKYLHV